MFNCFYFTKERDLTKIIGGLLSKQFEDTHTKQTNMTKMR